MNAKAPAEIVLEFADGDYLFRLPLRLLAELQRLRGLPVTWPDGSAGIRPKAFGTIWREQMNGEYDPLDCREIVRLALIGGGQGVVSGSGLDVVVNEVRAGQLVATYFDAWPEEDKWDLSRAILVAVAQGYTPPPADPDDKGDGDSGNAPRAEMMDSSTSPASSETP